MAESEHYPLLLLDRLGKVERTQCGSGRRYGYGFRFRAAGVRHTRLTARSGYDRAGTRERPPSAVVSEVDGNSSQPVSKLVGYRHLQRLR